MISLHSLSRIGGEQAGDHAESVGLGHNNTASNIAISHVRRGSRPRSGWPRRLFLHVQKWRLPGDAADVQLAASHVILANHNSPIASHFIWEAPVQKCQPIMHFTMKIHHHPEDLLYHSQALLQDPVPSHSRPAAVLRTFWSWKCHFKACPTEENSEGLTATHVLTAVQTYCGSLEYPR